MSPQQWLRDDAGERLAASVAILCGVVNATTDDANGFVVVVMDDGRYTLATRQVFKTDMDARTYAATASESRKPLVVSGKWMDLCLTE